MSRNRSSRRGSVAVIMALMVFVLLAAGAMALDWGRVSVARTQVQAAADSGALAATSSMANGTTDSALALSLARAYSSQVTANNLVPQVDDDGVVYGSWDGAVFTPTAVDPDSVRVHAYEDVPMTLTRFFGVSSVRVHGIAGAEPNVVPKRAPDMVLVLDVTQSMSASELAGERNAAQAMLDCIKDNATDDSRLALGLFTGVDTVLLDMTEVGDGYGLLSSQISAIRGCNSTGMPECSGTNHSAGLGNALAILEDADTPEGVGQAVLLMSDGEPNANDICNTKYFTGEGWRTELEAKCAALPESCTTRRGVTTCGPGQPDEATYLAWVQEYQADAEAGNIDVYTVYYGSSSAGIDYLADNVRAGNGFSLTAPSADDMVEAFEDICLDYVEGNAGLIF